MSLRSSWLTLALTACGRFEFDAMPPDAAVASDATDDVAAAHDEDGDGLVDADDPCPHVAGDAADTDGDGVGDVCDPNRSVATETMTVFATLQPGDHPFEDITAFAQEPDGLRYAQPSGGANIARPIATARIELGFEIHGLVGTGQRQVASGLDNGTTPYYFVELNQNEQGIRNVAVVSYDPTNGYVMLDTVEHAGMRAGVGLLRYDVDASAGSFSLVTGWIDELYTANASTPAYTGAPLIRFTFNGLDLTLRYVVIIETS